MLCCNIGTEFKKPSPEYSSLASKIYGYLLCVYSPVSDVMPSHKLNINFGFLCLILSKVICITQLAACTSISKFELSGMSIFLFRIFKLLIWSSVAYNAWTILSQWTQVIFAEPVVITACEFLEQNAASASHSVSLVGYVFLVALFIISSSCHLRVFCLYWELIYISHKIIVQSSCRNSIL